MLWLLHRFDMPQSTGKHISGLCILSFNPKLSALCTTAFVGGPSSLHWSLNIHRDVPYYKRNESLQAVIWQSYCCREPFTKTFIHLPGSHRKGGTQKRFQFQLATYRVLDHNIPTHRSGHRSLCEQELKRITHASALASFLSFNSSSASSSSCWAFSSCSFLASIWSK